MMTENTMNNFVYLFAAYFIIVTAVLMYLLRNFAKLTRIEQKLQLKDSPR